jgi:tetratricopeptide (TPR) repeat protein
MGGKQTRRRQHFSLLIAGLIFLAGCTAGKIEKVPERVEKPPVRDEARETLALAQKLLASGEYDAATQLTQKALLLSGRKPPADEALFQLGLLYAHFKNPGKDYPKALNHFRKLIEDHPQSPWAERAQVWMALLQENETAHKLMNKMREENFTSTQTIKKLKEDNDNLTEVIQKLKQIDIEIEEKKKKTQ